MTINDNYKKELLNSIPVVKSMNLEIVEIKANSLTLMAPLSQNINYEGTAFGGSINTLCVLSSYLLVHHILKSKNIKFSSLVIQDSTIKYQKPVNSDFLATATISEPAIEKFLQSLTKRDLARVATEAVVTNKNGQDIKAKFKSRFVAKL